MVAVIAHAEAALDQVGDALGGPQVALPSVGACSPEQQWSQGLSLRVGEFGFGARVWPGVEAAWSLALQCLSPSVHGALVDTEAARHLGLGQSAIEQAHGPLPTALELLGGSVGSHGDQRTHRRGRSYPFLAFSVQRSVINSTIMEMLTFETASRPSAEQLFDKWQNAFFKATERAYQLNERSL